MNKEERNFYIRNQAEKAIMNIYKQIYNVDIKIELAKQMPDYNALLNAFVDGVESGINLVEDKIKNG